MDQKTRWFEMGLLSEDRSQALHINFFICKPLKVFTLVKDCAVPFGQVRVQAIVAKSWSVCLSKGS